jgi:hypothetical protein
MWSYILQYLHSIMWFYVKGFKVKVFLLENNDFFVFIVFGLSPELETDQAF